MASPVREHPEAVANLTRRLTAMTIAHETRNYDEGHDGDQSPCACNNGWISIGQIVLEPETGEEVEEFALYLCQRCNEAGAV